MEDDLKVLKEKLNTIPDDVLERIGVGLFEDPVLTLIWDDEDWTEQFYKAEKKYPALKEVHKFFDSANRVFKEEKGYVDEDARMQFPRNEGGDGADSSHV